ncbi:unnamed protein product [Paramecium sonneborni]|uniref:Uncharacterized protein n=1 Tax=Paramecium sonneborni TaxID=65129 RepID=A0A8S1N3G5_9CILI|nr:unnamed protein product [Paramecium sonneborni]
MNSLTSSFLKMRNNINLQCVCQQANKPIMKVVPTCPFIEFLT